jgi:hypothetical protein
VAAPATDPSAAAADLAWEVPGVGGRLLRAASPVVALPGHDPAIGGSVIAWHIGDAVTIARRDTLAPVLQLQIAGVQKLAVSDRWLAFRRGRPGGGTVVGVKSLAAPTTPARTLARAAGSGELGRPSLDPDGDTVAFHAAGRRGSSIVLANAATGTERRVRRSRTVEVLNPSLRAGTLLYVQVGRCHQELRLRSLATGRERVLERRAGPARIDRGHDRGRTSQGVEPGLCPRAAGASWTFWTTELTSRYAYLTEFRPRAPARARVVRIAR